MNLCVFNFLPNFLQSRKRKVHCVSVQILVRVNNCVSYLVFEVLKLFQPVLCVLVTIIHLGLLTRGSTVTFESFALLKQKGIANFFTSLGVKFEDKWSKVVFPLFGDFIVDKVIQ